MFFTTVGEMDKWMDRQTDRWTDEWTDGWTNKQTDGWTEQTISSNSFFFLMKMRASQLIKKLFLIEKHMSGSLRYPEVP